MSRGNRIFGNIQNKRSGKKYVRNFQKASYGENAYEVLSNAMRALTKNSFSVWCPTNLAADAADPKQPQPTSYHFSIFYVAGR